MYSASIIKGNGLTRALYKIKRYFGLEPKLYPIRILIVFNVVFALE